MPNHEHRNIVIVGTGQAGGWAAQTLRKEGFAGKVVLIGEEPHRPYERPPLSKAVLVRRRACREHPPDQAWRPSRSSSWTGGRMSGVTSHRPAGQAVRSRPGEPIGYDKLILCNGGRARTTGHSGRGPARLVHAAQHRGCARAGRELLPGKKIVVVGGGWIGLEVAATARKKGMEVTVVEAMPPPVRAHRAARDLRLPVEAAFARTARR